MKYIEVKIFTSKQGIEPLSSVIMSLGMTDFVIEDPTEIVALLDKKNRYDWDYIDEKVLAAADMEASITLYLEDSDEGRKMLQKINAEVTELKRREIDGVFGQGVSFGRLYVDDRKTDDKTWLNNWKGYFKPVKVTDHIIIKPTWEEYQSREGELVIEIDPGMAFGTGKHPTTSLCLKFMERCAGEFKRVLDVGCGSGVLSIAAALLGAENVLGVESDETAISIAKENVGLNGLSDKIRIVCGDLVKGIDFKADLVTANLMADLVILLAEDVCKNLTPGGLFISSGVLLEKQDEVKAGIKNAGFEILDIMEDNEWCAILARLKKSAV